jgi:uncharacterized membrane protein HdeD (DUF308 family)
LCERNIEVEDLVVPNSYTENRQGCFMSASNIGSDLTGEFKRNAGWGIVLGILTAVLGLLLIAYPLFTATLTTIFIGWILIATGIFEVVQALRVNNVGTFFARLLLGLVYGFGGVMLLLYPLRGVAVLTMLISLVLLFEAGATAVLAFEVKSVSGTSWLVVDAIITAFLGFLILAHWPSSLIWAIGTLVGAAILVRGITRIALSTRLHRATKRVEEIHFRPPRAA